MALVSAEKHVRSKQRKQVFEELFHPQSVANGHIKPLSYNNIKKPLPHALNP